MTRGDLVVVIACVVAGYWLVSALLGLRGSGGATPPPGTPQAAEDDPEAPATLANWYRILGVREDAGREEIVAAWRRKVGEYHPDKVMQMAPEIRDLASRRTQRLNAAYELGMRLFR